MFGTPDSSGGLPETRLQAWRGQLQKVINPYNCSWLYLHCTVCHVETLFKPVQLLTLLS